MDLFNRLGLLFAGLTLISFSTVMLYIAFAAKSSDMVMLFVAGIISPLLFAAIQMFARTFWSVAGESRE